MNSTTKLNWFNKLNLKLRTFLASQIFMALLVLTAVLVGARLELLRKFASDWQILVALLVFDAYITGVVYLTLARPEVMTDERVDFVELKSARISYQILTNLMALYVLAGLVFKFEHQAVWYLLCSSFLIHFLVRKYQQSRL